MVRANVRAYIAHTFKHRKYVKDILIPKINALGIATRNPFYEADGTSKRKEVLLADKCDINESTSEILPSREGNKDKEKWVNMIRLNDKTIVKRDLGFVDRTDFTIAYMTDISAGTTCEIFYTGIIKRRPVFLLTNNTTIIGHPWISYACRYGKICKTVDELLKVLERRYG